MSSINTPVGSRSFGDSTSSRGSAQKIDSAEKNPLFEDFTYSEDLS
jgi:hypothetical protein